jgi:hypothetical protein
VTLRADELASYRAAVISCAKEDDTDACERLLGQLATFEAQGYDSDEELTFIPQPGAHDLASRAFTDLRLKPFQRRSRVSAR